MMKGWWSRLRRSLLRTPQDDRDLDDEIAFHLTQERLRRVGLGVAPGEAARGARLELGSAALVKERTRAIWVSSALEQLLQDLRYGSRILTKSPGVSTTAILLIALVVGGNTTIFSIANGILHNPMPGVRADRLINVSWVAEDGFVETHIGHDVYVQLRDRGTSLQPLAAFDLRSVVMVNGAASSLVRMGLVSENYFETLGVRLVQGRSFTPDEARGSSGLVAILSHRLWQNAFAADADPIGQRLILNGRPAMVVGIAEPKFHGSMLGEEHDLWVPVAADLDSGPQGPDSGSVAVVGRLAPDRSREEAQAELTALLNQVPSDPSVTQRFKPRLVPYSGVSGGNSVTAIYGNRMLAIFSIVTLLTIAIVCANVANLLTARAVVRQREIALRQSLGASRLRIVRGLFAEGLVLSSVAWSAACLFAWWVSRAATSGLLDEVEREGPVLLPDLTPDWTVVVYALELSVLCTLAVTIAPALRVWGQPLVPFLKVGEQGIVQAGSRLSRALVVVQLAFSVLLLTTAAFAQRSLSLTSAFDPGFSTRPILLAAVNTAAAAPGPAANRELLAAIQSRLAQLPGVEATSYAPSFGVLGWVDFPVRRDRSSDPVMASDNHVASGYFAAMNVDFVAGGDFDGRQAGAIITQSLAEALWPGESAVGKTLVAGPNQRAAGVGVDVPVIGIVRDAHFTGQARETPPRYIFFSIGERTQPPGGYTFYLRHDGRQQILAPAVNRALRDLQAEIVATNVRPFDTELARRAAPMRMVTSLATMFAGVSLLIAAIGQYAVVAFNGRRRFREFGLRLALGATNEHVIRSVVAENARATLVGLLIGFVLSLGVGAILARALYGITPTDPVTFAGVFALMAAASLIACYLPARRAAAVDPLMALRAE